MAWRFGLNRRSGLIGSIAARGSMAAAMTLALLAGRGAFGRNGSRRGGAFADGRDGIGSGFTRGAEPRATPQQIAERILAEHGKGTDDALVLVARYLGGPR